MYINLNTIPLSVWHFILFVKNTGSHWKPIENVIFQLLVADYYFLFFFNRRILLKAANPSRLFSRLWKIVWPFSNLLANCLLRTHRKRVCSINTRIVIMVDDYSSLEDIFYCHRRNQLWPSLYLLVVITKADVHLYLKLIKKLRVHLLIEFKGDQVSLNKNYGFRWFMRVYAIWWIWFSIWMSFWVD